jgi:hypothetical protein
VRHFHHVRIAKLVRFRPDPGIIDLVDFMCMEGLIPPGFFASRSQITTACRFLERPVTLGVPVIITGYLDSEEEHMIWDRFKNTNITELWEDGTRLTVHIEIVETPDRMQVASSYLRAHLTPAQLAQVQKPEQPPQQTQQAPVVIPMNPTTQEKPAAPEQPGVLSSPGKRARERERGDSASEKAFTRAWEEDTTAPGQDEEMDLASGNGDERSQEDEEADL